MVESNPAPALPCSVPCLASPRFFRPPHSCSCHLDFSLPLCSLCVARGWLLPLPPPLLDVRSRLASELERFRQQPIRNGHTPATRSTGPTLSFCRANPPPQIRTAPALTTKPGRAAAMSLWMASFFSSTVDETLQQPCLPWLIHRERKATHHTDHSDKT